MPDGRLLRSGVEYEAMSNDEEDVEPEDEMEQVDVEEEDSQGNSVMQGEGRVRRMHDRSMRDDSPESSPSRAPRQRYQISRSSKRETEAAVASLQRSGDQYQPKKRYNFFMRKPATEYFCTICNKLFRHPSKIAEHMRKHNGERPFICIVCNARFTQGGALKVHMRQHKNEFPFKCSYCHLQFSTPGIARGHEQLCCRKDDMTRQLHSEDIRVMRAQRALMGVNGGVSMMNHERDGSLENEEEIESMEMQCQQQMIAEGFVYECPIYGCRFQHESRDEVEDHMREHGNQWADEALTEEDEKPPKRIAKVKRPRTARHTNVDETAQAADQITEEEMAQAAEQIREDEAAQAAEQITVDGDMEGYEEGGYEGEMNDDYYYEVIDQGVQEERNGHSQLNEGIVKEENESTEKEPPPPPSMAMGQHPKYMIRYPDNPPGTRFLHGKRYRATMVPGPSFIIEEDEHLEEKRRKEIREDHRTKRLLTLASTSREPSTFASSIPQRGVTYMDVNAPQATYEVEVMTTEEPHVHQDDEKVYAGISNNEDEDLEVIGVEEEEELVEVEEEYKMSGRVRLVADPRPPSKGHKFSKWEYNMTQLEEVEVDASVLAQVMPRPPRIVGQNKRRRRRNPAEPGTARNLDWIIDAVAAGQDVDDASPHNRKKPVVHKCIYCGKVDKYPSKIEAHMRTHTGEKPYKCEICGQGFTQNTPLRMHMRRHLDQRSYVCEVDDCGMRFVSQALLNAHHSSKHSSIKKHVCLKGCGRWFATGRNQRVHEAKCNHYARNRSIVNSDYNTHHDDGMHSPYISDVSVDNYLVESNELPVEEELDVVLEEDEMGLDREDEMIPSHHSMYGGHTPHDEIDVVNDPVIGSMQPNFL